MTNTHNGNTNGKPGVKSGIRRPGSPRRVVDLHDPSIDPTGRVDVLVARAVKTVVGQIKDPVLQMLYGQFQGVLDNQIHRTLRRYNCRKGMEELGIIERPIAKPKSGAGVRRSRVLRTRKQDL